MVALLKCLSGLAIEFLRRGADPDTPRANGISAVDVAELMLDQGYLQVLKTVPVNQLYKVPTDLKTTLKAKGMIGADAGDKWDTAFGAAVVKLQRALGLTAHGHPSRALTKALDAHNLYAAFLTYVRKGDWKSVDMLGKENAKLVSAEDSNGWTALMHASYAGQSNVARYLLSKGAQVNAVDKGGSTSLLLATVSSGPSSEEKIAVIKVLLDNGAKDVQNREGLTARTAAEKLGPQMMAAVEGKASTLPRQIYIALMGRPGFKKQDYHCDSSLQGGWIDKKWKEGLRIEGIAGVGKQLCVIAGQSVPNERSESLQSVVSLREMGRVFEEQRGQHRSLVDLTNFDGSFQMLFATPRSSGNGYTMVSDSELATSIKQTVYDKGWAVTKVVGQGDSWIYLYGDEPGYTKQGWFAGGLSFVIKKSVESWNKGMHVTSLSRNNQRWLAIVSAGSGLKDQSFVVAEDESTFTARIAEKYRSGWRIKSMMLENI
jgi:hypothetical protein